MQYLKATLITTLVNFFDGDLRRIEHALSVMREAEQIAATKQEYDYDILIAATILHDVGIKPSEEKLGYNNGRTQEEYGPPIVHELLSGIGFPADKTRIVCEIIGNHHSPSRYTYPELAILKEADRIINRLEEGVQNNNKEHA